jgi:hypothetical protein
MTAQPFRRLVPEDNGHARDIAVRGLVRSVVAEMISRDGHRLETPDIVAERLWPRDQHSQMVLKAASNPATVGTPGWAGSLGGSMTADFIDVLGPSCASARLLQRGFRFHWDRSSQIRVPGLVSAPTNIRFVAEAAPIAVIDLFTSGVVLKPQKLPIICAFSRETFQHSVPAVELLVRAALTDSVSWALDNVMFSANAGDTITPPGLLNGIAALPASTSTIPSEALFEDFAKLAAAVGAVAGSNSIVFVAAAQQAEAAKLRISTTREILSSPTLAAGTVVAVAANGLASAYDDIPRFDTSLNSLLHFETSPSAIGTPGSPNVVAAPAVSAFQSDLISLRMILNVTWGLRHSSAVAWMQNVAW